MRPGDALMMGVARGRVRRDWSIEMKAWSRLQMP